MLYELAVRSGVDVQWDTSVTAVRQATGERPTATVELSTGQTITADIVVGADGPQSIIRKNIFGATTPPSADAVVTLYSATVHATQLAHDAELNSLIQKGDVSGEIVVELPLLRLTCIYIIVVNLYGLTSKLWWSVSRTFSNNIFKLTSSYPQNEQHIQLYVLRPDIFRTRLIDIGDSGQSRNSRFTFALMKIQTLAKSPRGLGVTSLRPRIYP